MTVHIQLGQMLVYMFEERCAKCDVGHEMAENQYATPGRRVTQGAGCREGAHPSMTSGLLDKGLNAVVQRALTHV
jgi:hypothetical protein